MSPNEQPSVIARAFADDLQAASGLLASIHGKSQLQKRPVLLLLAAVWLSIERLRQTVQTSVQGESWKSSEAATLAKGRELGIEARPGESMASYRARLSHGGRS